MADFGASFKRAREAKGVSLDKIAEETRISTRFLHAIENEDFHLLPGGIFNRGFVRTYAERVGLDPNQAVADYERLAEYREPDEPVRPASAARETNTAERHLYVGAFGILVLLIAIYYLAARDTGTPTQIAEERPPVVTAPAPIVTPPPPPIETQAAAEPAPPPVQELSIEVQASETTWVKLITDGSTTTEEILEPGMMRRYIANESIDITIGNAGGLTMKVNDQPLRRALGRSGQVRQFVLTHDNAAEIIG